MRKILISLFRVIAKRYDVKGNTSLRFKASKRGWLVCFLLVVSIGAQAQMDLDSLMTIWNNTNAQDAVRSKAFFQYIQDGWMRRDPNTAFVFAEQYLEFAESKGLDKAKANALHLMGNAQRLKSKFKTALEYYQQSIATRERIGDYGPMYASTLNNIGNVYVKSGQYDMALNQYQQSASAARETGDDRRLASVLNNLGNIYNIQGNCIEAINFYDRSLKLKESLGDKMGMGSSLNNIGNVYNRQGYPEQAIRYYQKSLKVREEINDERGQASSLLNLGLIIANYQKHYDQALLYLERSRLIREKIGDRKGLIDTFNGIGKVCLQLEQNERAIGFFNRSLELLTKVDFKLGLSRALSGLGSAYAASNNYEKAIEHNKESLRIAKSIGAKKEIMTASEALYTNYEQTNQYQLAFTMIKLFMKSRDSIANLKSQRRILQHEFEQRALADSIKNADTIRLQQVLVDNEVQKNRRKQQQAYLLYGGMLLLIIFLTILYNRFRVATFRKRVIESQKLMADETNRELVEKNEMIQAQADEIKVINARIRSINQSLERRVMERTRKIEQQHDKLKKYAFSNSHVVRAPLSRLMGLINLWDEPNISVEERTLIAELISISAHELDEIVRNLNEVLNSEERKSA
ncbi:MAG: tetratricopeptide repeat protein [Cytophagales bacterium]|nr:tetratricopeptide repeat protein [Cytophagales bacterium]